MERKMTHNRLDEINRILGKKSDAYAEFLTATLLLKKSLENEDMATVTRMIERRAALIGMVDGLDRELIRCRRIGPYDQMEAIVRRTAAVSDSGEKFRQILSANQECEAAATDQLMKLEKDLQNLHEQEEGLHGYIGHAEPISRFLSVRT
jgi:hypothetical protein